MQVTLKRIEPGPVMIGPEEARYGDTLRLVGGGLGWVEYLAEECVGIYTANYGAVKWCKSLQAKHELVARVDGGMPKSEGHRLGDLPVGAIVPVLAIENGRSDSGFWRVHTLSADGRIELRNTETGGVTWRHSDTRIAVAYEAIEFQEPE